MQKQGLRKAVAFLDSWLAYRAKGVDMPGFSVAILYGDEIVFSRAYGLANIKKKQPLTTNHLFNAASQTKMLTATAVLRLAEQGKLALDEPVCAYLPWLTDHTDKRFQEITIRHLLSHSSGLLRDGMVADYWQLEHPFPDENALRRTVLRAPLAFDPNAKLKYSNAGYALLGLIVKAATGRPYRTTIRQIMRQAGMRSAVPDYTPAIAGGLAIGYTPVHQGRRLELHRNTTTGALVSSVGLCATPEDMCRFVSNHFYGNDTLLGNTMKQRAHSRQWAITEGYDSGVAFGMGFECMSLGDRELLGHNAHMAGHTTATYFDPQQKIAVSVAANCKDAPTVRIVRGIFEALDYFATIEQPTPPHLARLEVRLYSHLANVQVVASGNQIVVIDPDDWEPFGWAEQAAYVEPNVLRITTSGSAFNEGELIQYSFGRDGALRLVRLAGVPLLPERLYFRSLSHSRA